MFPEWYWGPILFMIIYGPVLTVAAFGADIAVRRWVRPLSWPQRGWLWAAVIGGGVVLILVIGAVRENVRFNREVSAAAAAIDFQPYEPNPLPRPFTEERVVADDNWTGPALISRYGAGPGAYATAFQQRPTGELSLQDGHCSVTKLAGTGTNFFDGPCRALRSPKGIPVFIGVSETIVDGGDASRCSARRSCGSRSPRSPIATSSPTSTRSSRSTRATSTSSAADTEWPHGLRPL